MKRLTKYKDGKFLLNHSSMNEAIDKLGKLEIINRINAKKTKIYFKIDNSIDNFTLYDDNRAYLDEDGNTLLIVRDEWEKSPNIEFQFLFTYYKKTWALTREDLEENANDIR